MAFQAFHNVLKCKSSSILRSLSHGFSQLQNVRLINRHNVRQISVGINLKEKISLTFIKANGEKIKTEDLDGFGACEGTLTCSTCHLIFKEADYNKLPHKPSDEEMDMLDLAYDLTDTSRLGCQIQLSKDMDGLEVHVPATINDARSS
ncbi:adrenodoxin-like protein 2, mitochondrial isoform X2 [Glossina fuscipes]|uniref:Adrenodoxin-like protein 2, mitochondrial isoform X2 n=1 Tax=Glossina fuscipes TaxID=7396 RepID=A0A8U0W6R3_9MUSC|nr:adrenodoxin-like protein 2, mitochondrial isoform X2 [Glossina fuscipes]